MKNTREKKFFVPHLATSRNNINKRWFVFWYEPIPGTDLAKRRKCYGQINYYKTEIERLAKAHEVIEVLKQNNFYYNRNVVEGSTKQTSKLLEVINHKVLRKHAKRFYKTHVSIFLKWLKKDALDCTPKDAQNFIDHLRNKKLSNTTTNHYRNTLKCLYAQLIEDSKLHVNPFAKTKKLPESRESQRAFTPYQITEIKQHLTIHDKELWLACEFIYYCFIRPNELRQLKIKSIDFYNNTITIPGSISKNKKTQTIAIPNSFAPSLQRLSKLDTDKYILGNNNKPIGETNMSDRFRSVRDELGYSKKHTLYSFKHTGAMMFIKKTKDVKALQLQLRHHSLDMVNEYLKNMGVLDNEEIRENFPAI